MKQIILFCLVFLIGSVSFSQIKVVHFKKLQECLPGKTPAGFTRNKPTGSTQTQMGMSTSEAGVRFSAEAKMDAAGVNIVEQAKTIEVKISDMVGMPYALMAFAWQQEYENESEEGYDKSVSVKNKYKGKEEAKKGEYKSCNISFGVANRFLVSIEGSGFDDVKLVYNLIDSIDLDKLEKLTGEAK